MTKNSVLQLRITDNQKDRWQRLAAAEHRTLTDWITQTLELALRRRHRPDRQPAPRRGLRAHRGRPTTAGPDPAESLDF